jgi:predicted RNA-binding Zn ribbon-like protein
MCFTGTDSTSKPYFASTIVNMQSLAELPFIGGHVSLDFVNTAEERGHPQAGDVLATPADLRLWGERYGLLKPAAASGNDAREFENALAARELLYALFLDRATGGQPADTQLAELARLAAGAYEAADLSVDDGRVEWRWNETDLASVRHTTVARAVELLRDGPTSRLKQCPGDHCGWLFLDTTKSGNRRWCSMSECGQEAKDAHRRARRQAR